MSERLSSLLGCIIDVVKSWYNFLFTHPYPGLAISIGAVLVGVFMIDYGLSLLRYFLNTHGNSVRESGGSK